MSYDPKVWTSESPSLSGYYHYASEMLNGWRIGSFAANDPMRKGHSELRSILPIPSAAEVAALVAVADKAQAIRNYEEQGGPQYVEWDEYYADLAAALARLDEARKEQCK